MRQVSINDLKAGDVVVSVEYGAKLIRTVESNTFKNGMYIIKFTNGDQSRKNFTAMFNVQN